MRKFFSVEGVFKTRHLVVMALMAALQVVLAPFSIYLTPTFRLLTFNFLPGALVAMLYGPWAALAFGFVADTVGYFVKPAGPYFIGYALSAMADNFIYACFLYNKPLQPRRALAAQILILVVTVFGLNYLWNALMYGAVASKHFTAARLINNLVQIPLRVTLVVAFGKLARRLDTGGGLTVRG